MADDVLDLDELSEALRPHLPADLDDDERRDVARELMKHISDGIAAGGNLAFIRDGRDGQVDVDVLTLQKIL